MELILASASPRRISLLKKLGLHFQVASPQVDENLPSIPGISNQVQVIAQRKAQFIGHSRVEGIILAADTVVVLEGEVLGKPSSVEQAKEMLFRLSGQSHEVFTGVALLNAQTGEIATDYVRTVVRFRPILPREIEAYVRTGEPMDKAGAYGIQEKGAVFVEEIKGCFYNVVGLPLNRVCKMLEEFGLDVFQTW